MFRISTLNKISNKGLDLLDDKYEITDKTEDAEGIIVRSADMHSMEFSEKLNAVARAGAGVNNIPLDKCADKGIVVFNTPGANANAVKELVIAGLFIAARNIPKALTWAASLRENVSASVEKGKSQFAGSEISGKTLGIVGLGAIGRKVAASAHALGMEVLGYDPYFSGELDNVHIHSNLEDLLPSCDYVTIHVPATDSTKGMFNSFLFEKMKTGAVLLNFSRDKLVRDEDLIEALKSQKLSSYVTDFPNDALVGADNVILLPHLGASTEEAEENCAVMAVRQMADFFENGNINNSVNFPKVDIGPLTGGVRFAFFTKNCQEPVSAVARQLEANGIKAEAVQGGTKGQYGYVLAETVLSSEQPLTISDGSIIKYMVFK